MTSIITAIVTNPRAIVAVLEIVAVIITAAYITIQARRDA